MSELDPGTASRRSPVYREFPDAGYRLIAGQPQAFTSQQTSREAALFDFSLMPRFGVRGAAAADYLRDREFETPEMVNTAVAGDQGRWVARLGKNEYWVLGATGEQDYPVSMIGPSGPAAGCYPVPCEEGRTWFVLRHPDKAAIMAKLCGVDLRENVFPLGGIVQTSLARVNAVIIHHAVFGENVFSVLSDVASARYLWGALDDALQEFGAGAGVLGKIVTLVG